MLIADCAIISLLLYKKIYSNLLFFTDMTTDGSSDSKKAKLDSEKIVEDMLDTLNSGSKEPENEKVVETVLTSYSDNSDEENQVAEIESPVKNKRRFVEEEEIKPTEMRKEDSPEIELSAANVADVTFEISSKSCKKTMNPASVKHNKFAVPSESSKPSRFNLNATVEVKSR